MLKAASISQGEDLTKNYLLQSPGLQSYSSGVGRVKSSEKMCQAAASWLVLLPPGRSVPVLPNVCNLSQ